MLLNSSEYTYDNFFRPWAPPLLRWAGSKRKLLPILMRCVPREYERYIEPFAGSACLFFALKPRTAILGDINEELLATYDIIRSHPRLVVRAAVSYDSTEKQYYRLRKQLPESLTPIDRAARFIYLNRYCFNGVYRTNKRGGFNVPRGIRTGTIQGEELFYRCSIALRSATLRSGDFSECLKDIRQGDFVYLDPPYAMTGHRRYGEYGYESFNNNDLKRLVECLKNIERVGAVFVLSYANCPALIKQLPKRWNFQSLSVRRHVAGFAKHRDTVIEILVSNQCW